MAEIKPKTQTELLSEFFQNYAEVRRLRELVSHGEDACKRIAAQLREDHGDLIGKTILLPGSQVGESLHTIKITLDDQPGYKTTEVIVTENHPNE